MDPDDMVRGAVESDDEDGPLNPEPEADAQPPDDTALDMEEESEDVADAPPRAPDLPARVTTCKGDELKQHLWWRNESTAGNKSELLARLQAAIDSAKAVRSDEEVARMLSKGKLPDVAGYNPTKKSAIQWEPVDSSKIDRPVYTGPEKFIPAPSLGLLPETHPFTYMDSFYPKQMRDLEVTNSIEYRGWLTATTGVKLYDTEADVRTRINSLAHATLILQGTTPVPDQRRMWTKSFAFKDHRSADMLTRDEWKVWKACSSTSATQPRRQNSGPLRGTSSTRCARCWICTCCAA